VAAGVLIALAFWRLLTDDRSVGSRAGWLVLAPVIAIAVVSPPALGALTANRAASAPPRPAAALPPLPDVVPVPIRVSDLVVRSYWDHGRSLRGHVVRVVGFVRATTERGFVLTRLVITCCAADAERNDVEISSDEPAPPRDTWIAVTGRFGGMSSVNPFTPLLSAISIRPVDAPDDPYE
jgi:uncharacterized repeat protein (TIGR03943 family)